MRGEKRPVTVAGVHALREEYTRTMKPTRALGTEASKMERKLKAEGRRQKAECRMQNALS